GDVSPVRAHGSVRPSGFGAFWVASTLSSILRERASGKKGEGGRLAALSLSQVSRLDQFDDGFLGAVAATGAELGDPGVAAGTVGVPRSHLREQVVDGVLVGDRLEDDPAGVHVA